MIVRVIEKFVGSWIEELKISADPAEFMLPTEISADLFDTSSGVRDGAITVLTDQAYAPLREAIARTINPAYATKAPGFTESTGIWTHPIPSLTATRLALHAMLEDMARPLSGSTPRQVTVPTWFKERVLPLYLGFVTQQVRATPMGREETGLFASESALKAQAILEYGGCPIGLAFGDELVPHVNVLVDYPEADDSSPERDAFRQLRASLSPDEEAKALKALADMLLKRKETKPADPTQKVSMPRALELVLELAKASLEKGMVPDYSVGLVGAANSAFKEARGLPVLLDVLPHFRFAETVPTEVGEVWRKDAGKVLDATLDTLTADGHSYCVTRVGELVLPEIDGMTVAAPTQTVPPNPVLYVWGNQDAAKLVGRTLILKGLWEGQIATLKVKLGDSISTTVLTKDVVLARRIVRFGKHPATGIPQYPHVPLKREFLHLLVKAESTCDLNAAHYRIAVKGHPIPIEETYSGTRIEDLADEGQSLAIACWPDPIEGLAKARRGHWKYWSFYLGDNGFTSDQLGVDFEVLGARASGGKLERLDDGIGTVRIVMNALEPKFVYVSKLEAEGAFELKSQGAASARAQSSANVGLDFGTSNTSVAVQVGEVAAAFDFASVKECQPLILVANSADTRLGIRTGFPWLPSVRSANESADTPDGEEAVQLPSGLFVATREPDWVKMLPLGGATMVAPGANVPAYKNAGLWHDNLKWMDQEGPTRCYLRGVLLWVAAAIEADQLVLRASYPLAFSDTKRREYDRLLESVLRWLVGQTGVGIAGLAVGGTPSATASDVCPFLGVDEASILLLGARAELEAEGLGDTGAEKQLALAVCVDIGGGTVDTSVGIISSGDSDSRCCQIVAAESCRFGANLVRKSVGRLLQVTSVQVLDHAIRRGLPDALWEPPEDAAPKIKKITKAMTSADSIREIKAVLCQYFVVLLEHTARLAAAVLLDIPTLVYRLHHGPGIGDNGEIKQRVGWVTNAESTVNLLVFPIRSGNGWRWLPQRYQKAWHNELVKRIKELVNESFQFRPAFQPGCTWEIGNVTNEELVFSWKKHTVAERGAMVNEKSLAGSAPQHCACDGFDNPGSKWFVHVGDGSLGNTDREIDFHNLGLNESAIRSFCDPVWRPKIGAIQNVLTPLPLASVKLMAVNARWPAEFQEPNPNKLVQVRKLQPGALDYRRLATFRGWLEAVVSCHFDEDWSRTMFEKQS